MDKPETLIEHIAAALVILDREDLPALAEVHENFMRLSKAAGDNEVISKVADKCAGLIGKIILHEAEDIDSTLDLIDEAVSGIQAIICDKRLPAEVKFPPEIYQTSEDNTANQSEAGNTLSSDNNTKNNESMILNVDGADIELLGEFITEAREHCANAEENLMDLETDPENHEAIDAIFRSFHTIKGAAGFLALEPISLLAHESETLLDKARRDQIIIEGKIADIVLGAVDAQRALLSGLEEAMVSGIPFDACGIVQSLIDDLHRLTGNLIDSDEFNNFDADMAGRVGDILIDMGATTQSEIDEALARRLSTDEKLGQTLVRQGKVPAKAVMHALRRQKKSRDLQKATVRETVKIDTERLDRLVDTIGELAIAEAMVGQDEQILATASPEMTKNISRLNKITRQLQEMGMSMRLVPIKGIFQRLSRAVRDLSKKSGKPVNLELSGEDAEVDRSIIESIGDPLMHMVRNSIDHGLETPDERINIGKPKTGTLTLRAFHKGGKICFEIEDDGRGLNRDKILARAIERGLVAKDKEITDREIYNLIFLPGFSTADKISEISGRGVGMDVVKKNIEAMHGHLEIDSRLGRGTRFSIQLPLTLAMIDGMMVGVGGQKFIIPTLSVVESVQLTLKVIKTVAGEGQKLIHRDELLPLFKIRTLFSQERMNRIYSDSTVVIVEDLKRRIGLVVDEVNGQHQFVIKSLGPMFQKQKCISGGAVLSDGTIGLILDIGGIIELAGVDKTFAGVSQ